MRVGGRWVTIPAAVIALVMLTAVTVVPNSTQPTAPTTSHPSASPDPVAIETLSEPLVIPAERLTPLPSSRPPVENQARLVDRPAPNLLPADHGWVGQRIAVPALGINIPLSMAGNAATEEFPPFSGAYILRSSSQPGRGTNSYVFAHAMPELFKPLWQARIGQQVVVTMSDGQELNYRITRIVPDVPCPDPSAPKPAGLPPALANATYCDTSWTLATASERLTLQTSQGFNRNYGELVIIAEPDW